MIHMGYMQRYEIILNDCDPIVEQFARESILSRSYDSTIFYVKTINDFFDMACTNGHKNISLADFSIDKIKDYICSVASTVNAFSVNNKLSALSSFGEFLCLNGNISHNPLDQVRRLHPYVTVSPFIPDYDEIVRLFSEVTYGFNLSNASYKYRVRHGTNIRDVALFWMIFNSGLSVKEILLLEKSDFQMDFKRISLNSFNGKYHMQKRKLQYLYLSDTILELIEHLIRFIEESENFYSDFIFCSMSDANQGNPLSVRYVNKLFNQYSAVCNLEHPITPNHLRKAGIRADFLMTNDIDYVMEKYAIVSVGTLMNIVANRRKNLSLSHLLTVMEHNRNAFLTLDQIVNTSKNP